jgi:hypothetical protein
MTLLLIDLAKTQNLLLKGHYQWFILVRIVTIPFHSRLKTLKKHNKLNHSNIESADKKAIDKTLKAYHLKNSSFLDFYCPKCKQATTILFTGGPSGYWGEFTFSISHVFVTKPTLESGKAKFITKIKKMLRIEKK